MGKETSKKPIVIRTKLIANYASRIGLAWNKAVESIFAVGDLLIQANKELGNDDEYNALLKELPFEKRTAERLVSIAKTNYIRKPAIQKLLPPCWGTLYEFSQFKDDEFKKANKENIFTPEITRTAVINYRNKLRGAKSKPTATTPLQIKHGPLDEVQAALIFEVPDKIDNPKTLIDLRFIQWLGSILFSNSANKCNVAVKISRPLEKKLAKVQEEFKKHAQFINLARQAQNHFREGSGKPELTDLQTMVSLLGVDPDKSYGRDFSLIENVVIAYLLRQGLSTSADLAKYRREVRPDIGILTDGLLKEAIKSVEALTSKSRSKTRGSKTRKRDSKVQDDDSTVYTETESN